jgi:hypothetical protein
LSSRFKNQLSLGKSGTDTDRVRSWTQTLVAAIVEEEQDLKMVISNGRKIVKNCLFFCPEEGKTTFF